MSPDGRIIPQTCESTQTEPEWSYCSTSAGSNASGGSNESTEVAEAVLDIGSPQIATAFATTTYKHRRIASSEQKPSREEIADAEHDASWPLNFVNEVVNAMSQSEAPASPVTRGASLPPGHMRRHMLELEEAEGPHAFDEVNVREAQLLVAKMLTPVSERPTRSRADRRRSAPPRTSMPTPRPHQQDSGSPLESLQGSPLRPLNGCMPHFPAAPQYRTGVTGLPRLPKQNPLLRHASPTSSWPQVQHS